MDEETLSLVYDFMVTHLLHNKYDYEVDNEVRKSYGIENWAIVSEANDILISEGIKLEKLETLKLLGKNQSEQLIYMWITEAKHG